MNDLDALTAKMFMNKTSYNKYLEKTEPKVFEKKRLYLTKLKKYRPRILQLVTEYLNNPEKNYSLAVNAVLSELGDILIKYFEVHDLDQAGGGCYETDAPDDADDTMFDVDVPPVYEKPPPSAVNSLWGKSITKSNYFLGTDLNYRNASKKKNSKMWMPKESDFEYDEGYGEDDEKKDREITEEDLA